MTTWINALRDYPGYSCAACEDTRRRDRVPPPCRAAACPVATPDGVEGIFARVWSALRDTNHILGPRGTLAALGVRPDLALIELIRAAESALRAPNRRKEVVNHE
ncbi:MAG: hypothetical protein HY804_00135 [Nitrospinae bacterium]|nr:hypothetical protein [Nitrospinota bacterium]